MTTHSDGGREAVVVEATECGVIEASCACILPPHHDGPHACDCGGMWSLNPFRAHALPMRKGMLSQAEAVERQREWLAVRAAREGGEKE